MDWLTYWTIVAQVAVGSIVFMIICVPVGFGISHLVYGVLRPLNKGLSEDDLTTMTTDVADIITDRIIYQGENSDR